jgi:hypothetical protein
MERLMKNGHINHVVQAVPLNKILPLVESWSLSRSNLVPELVEGLGDYVNPSPEVKLRQ